MIVALLAIVLVLWDLPEPPTCERRGAVKVYGLTLAEVVVKAQEKAAKRGADTVWVETLKEPGACGGWYRIKGVALVCNGTKRPQEGQKEE